MRVIGMNMLSDAPEGQDITEIYFAQVGLKDNVVNGVKETPTRVVNNRNYSLFDDED